jgi:fucose permease
MSGMQAVNTLTVAGAVIVGLALALLGRLKVAVAERVDLGERRVHTGLLGLYLALVPLTLAAGMIVDRWGVRPMMILGSIVLALALLRLSAAANFREARTGLLAAGLGVAALSAATVAIMPKAFFGARETAASLQMGTVFIALGGLLAPWLADVAVLGLGSRRGLALLAFVCLIPALAAALPAGDDLRLGEAPGGLTGVLTDPDLLMAGLVLFLYAPLEAAVSLWTATHLNSGDGRRASWLLAGFWAAFLCSRLLFGVIEHAGLLDESRGGFLLVLPALLAAVLFGNLSGASRRERPAWSLLLLGFLLGPIFPTLLGMAFRLPRSQDAQAYGTVYGVLFAAGTLGSLLLAPLLARDAHKPIAYPWRAPIFLALGLTAVSLVFAVMS